MKVVLQRGDEKFQNKPRFKKRLSNQFPSNLPKAREDRASNPKYQNERGTSSPSKKPSCGKCGKKHWGEFLVEMENFFGHDKNGNKVRDCYNVKGQDNGSGHTNGSNADASKKNHFYSLWSWGEQESSPNVVTGMLQVFSINVYSLLDPGATLSFFLLW